MPNAILSRSHWMPAGTWCWAQVIDSSSTVRLIVTKPPRAHSGSGSVAGNRAMARRSAWMRKVKVGVAITPDCGRRRRPRRARELPSAPGAHRAAADSEPGRSAA
jgi:hypothetical protein